MGLWYILEYQYPTEMAVADLSCLSFRFREAEEGIIGNFTFNSRLGMVSSTTCPPSPTLSPMDK